jgi:hypothetical protein
MGSAHSRAMAQYEVETCGKLSHGQSCRPSLSRQLGGVDRQIAVTRKAYDEAAAH